MPRAKTPKEPKIPPTPYPIVIDIPNWHPTRLNQMIGYHRCVIARRKKADREMIRGYFCRSNAPVATGKRRLRLTIILGPRQRAPDPDAHWKSLNDALVHCCALRDDNRQWVELMPVEYERATIKATRIELEDIANT